MTTITKQMHKDPNGWIHISTYLMLTGTTMSLLDDEEEDSCVKKYSALVGAKLFSFLAIPIGIIDTIFWTAIFLATKTIHIFIPRSFEMATSICSWLYTHANVALGMTILATNRTLFAFFKSEDEMDKCMDDCLKICAPVVDFQLFD